MRIGILLFLIIGLHTSNAQTDFEEKIVGTWKFVAEIRNNADGEEQRILGKSTKNDPLISDNVQFTFKSDKTMIITVEEFTLEAIYEINDIELTIGESRYLLLDVQKDKLFFKDRDTLLNSRYEYKRILKNE
ncbi:hypothetical protein H2O64_16320 [Kordia sp. YSTF-M3]|uniref:Lipocalin-like domain-containing protein n=1 Tax=Kordia aestuariivivens TaxID=2759037 RepID=A0ABR7QCE5_9FLAO|nr:hypothetical protein [Kordia aestuariivivens]MBC8756242.1 hypothetical protein [Kordia aestuariivivens]